MFNTDLFGGPCLCLVNKGIFTARYRSIDTGAYLFSGKIRIGEYDYAACFLGKLYLPQNFLAKMRAMGFYGITVQIAF